VFARAVANDSRSIVLPSNAVVRSFTLDGRARAGLRRPSRGGPPVKTCAFYGFADGCSVLTRRGKGLRECHDGLRRGAACAERPGPDGVCDATCGCDGTCGPPTCHDAAGPTARTCDDDADCREGEECGPSLFEFRDRLPGGVGPFSVPSSGGAGTDAHVLHALENVPDGIQQTQDLIASRFPRRSTAASP
jgi:hypothetical protein